MMAPAADDDLNNALLMKLLDGQSRMERTLGGIDERLFNINTDAIATKERLADHETRITRSERRWARLYGQMALGTAGAGILGGLFAWLADRYLKGTSI